MKKFRLVLVLILLFTGNCFAQWVDVGRYKEVSTGVSGADNGYLSKDGNFYYFKDNTSLFRLNIESGAVDTIIKPNEMGATLTFTQFVLSDDERYLFYCNVSLVKYDIINKVLTSANDKIIGLIEEDRDNYRSLTRSMHSIAFHKNKVYIYLKVHESTASSRYSKYGFMAIYDADSLKQIKNYRFGEFESIVYSHNYDTCYIRSTGLNYFQGNTTSTDLSLLDMNSLTLQRKTCYYFGDHTGWNVYEYYQPKYFGQGVMNYMPNSNILMSYYSNTLYLFDYDSTFVDSVKIIDMLRYEPDFSEKNILFRSKKQNWLFFYSLDINNLIDSISISGKHVKKIQRLHEDNSFIFSMMKA